MSERLFYQKVTDIYATSIDYDPGAEMTERFFQTVQNKMHSAAHGHTAAEIVCARADATKPHMRLTNWKNAPTGPVRKRHAIVAKNCLTHAGKISPIVAKEHALAEFAAYDAERIRLTAEQPASDFDRTVGELKRLEQKSTHPHKVKKPGRGEKKAGTG